MEFNEDSLRENLILASLIISFIGAFFISFKTYKAMKRPSNKWLKTIISVVIFLFGYAIIFGILGALTLYSFPIDFSR